MSKKKTASALPSSQQEPQIEGTGLALEYVIERLSVGRTPEELIKQHPELSSGAIETAKKQLLFLARYENRTAFYERMRVRHLIAALHPHPVVEKICDTFNAVSLGNGQSLHQLLCASRWGEDESGHPLSDQEYCQLRTQDEINQWQAIKLGDLDMLGCFSHCDAESLRYYLPARMIQDMANLLPISWEVAYDLDIHSLSDRYSLLNQQQKKAIASYLWYTLSAFNVEKQMQNQVLLQKIQKVLDGYWLQYL